MRILLLSQWYPPEPQKVVSDLAESLQECGHEVTVLTGFPNYPTGKLYPGYRLKLSMREELNGIPVLRVPLFPDHSCSAMKRALNFLSFAFFAALIGPWLIPRVDVVYVIHPPLTVGTPAWLLSRILGVPFVYEIQDMWPETLRATGMVNSKCLLGIVGWWAKWVYRRAAAIRVISPGFRENLIGKGVSADKIRVISNWVDTDFYHPVDADPQLAGELGLANRFNVMFAGTVGLAQGLETILEAASLLRDQGDVQFVLVGEGADRARLQEEARSRGLTNVKFLGHYPAQDMPRLYALADVLLVHLRDDPLFHITIPHKVFAYMASAKPILAAVNGDAASVVTSADAGIACPPGNPLALAEAVREFRLLTAERRRAIGANGRRSACAEYSRTALVARIHALLEQVVGQSCGGPSVEKAARQGQGQTLGEQDRRAA